jgi:hypothetical protein
MLGTEEDDLQSKIWYCTEQELLVRLTKLIREIWCVTLQWLRRNCGRGCGDSPRRRAEEAPLFLELPVAHYTLQYRVWAGPFNRAPPKLHPFLSLIQL